MVAIRSGDFQRGLMLATAFAVLVLPTEAEAYTPRRVIRPLTNLWIGWIMIGVVEREDIVCHIQFSLVAEFFKKPPDDGFVIFC